MSAAPSAPRLEPYRWLFPLGIAYAWMGVLLWPLQRWGVVVDASTPHRALMMLGFEQAFILGFLLTAMPGLTHGDPCRPWELALAVASSFEVKRKPPSPEIDSTGTSGRACWAPSAVAKPQPRLSW